MILSSQMLLESTPDTSCLPAFLRIRPLQISRCRTANPKTFDPLAVRNSSGKIRHQSADQQHVMCHGSVGKYRICGHSAAKILPDIPIRVKSVRWWIRSQSVYLSGTDESHAVNDNSCPAYHVLMMSHWKSLNPTIHYTMFDTCRILIKLSGYDVS